MPLAMSASPPELMTAGMYEAVSGLLGSAPSYDTPWGFEGQPAPTLEDIRGPLCVVFTKSRQEKALARELLDAGHPYLLPYSARRDASRNLVLSPLFAGILFAAAASPTNPAFSPESQRALSDRKAVAGLPVSVIEQLLYIQQYPNCPLLEGEALISESRRTFRILRPVDQTRFRRELALLCSEPALRRTARAESIVPKTGQTVQFADGPFSGMHGKVTQAKPGRNGKIRTYLDTGFMGAASIEIDAECLKRL